MRYAAVLATGALTLATIAGQVPASAAATPPASAPAPVVVAGPTATTRHIAVDQFGYLPTMRKVAVFADPQSG